MEWYGLIWFGMVWYGLTCTLAQYSILLEVGLNIHSYVYVAQTWYCSFWALAHTIIYIKLWTKFIVPFKADGL